MLYVSEGDSFVGEHFNSIFLVKTGKLDHYYKTRVSSYLPGESVLIVINIRLSDPQDEVNGASEQPGAHSDWLTLNIGGRLFTTTRSVACVWEMCRSHESLFINCFI